ncbi:hypothetical protein V8F20_011347 [Naviculisporaceae sp. PSN 640]
MTEIEKGCKDVEVPFFHDNKLPHNIQTSAPNDNPTSTNTTSGTLLSIQNFLISIQLSSTNLIAIVAALSHVVSGTVFTGTLTLPTGDKRNVAWTNGAVNPWEETTTIGSGSGNPCGQVFSAGGVGGFELVGVRRKRPDSFPPVSLQLCFPASRGWRLPRHG